MGDSTNGNSIPDCPYSTVSPCGLRRSTHGRATAHAFLYSSFPNSIAPSDDHARRRRDSYRAISIANCYSGHHNPNRFGTELDAIATGSRFVADDYFDAGGNFINRGHFYTSNRPFTNPSSGHSCTYAHSFIYSRAYRNPKSANTDGRSFNNTHPNGNLSHLLQLQRRCPG